ncbi:MAG: non-ribosomal peptide synthase/polyketide synthase [Myxococcota bacterium]
MAASEADIEDIYELTPMQQGMLFHSLLDPSAGMYVEQMSCDVFGALPISLWKDAWQRIVERHAILRSEFMWEGLEKPLQVVLREATLPWHLEDLRGKSGPEQEAHIDAFLAGDRARGFDLTQPPLVRCALFQLGDKAHRFVWTYHHVLLDGWCFSIVLKEVLTVVERGVEGLPPAPRPYRDYISWLQAQDPAHAQGFWSEALSGFSEATALPFIDAQVRAPEHQGAAAEAAHEIIGHLPADLTAGMVELAKSAHVTLNTIVQGAWALLLGRAADTDDVVFGVTVSGRPAELEGSEGIVGLFINTVPLRARLLDDLSVGAYLAQLQAQAGAGDPYSYSSLADIQVWSEAPHDRPLFQTLMVFENYPMDRSALLERNDLEITNIKTYERTNYPLTVIAIPGKELELRVMFDQALYASALAERLHALLIGLVSAFVTRGAGTKLSELGLLDEAGKKTLAAWNQTEQRFELSTPVHALVAARAKEKPEAIAVVGPDGTALRYRELDARAERIAQHLIARGVGPGSIVGVCIGRSLEMVTAIYGILKAGAAYLPTDPSYPLERLEFIAKDANPPLILISGADPYGEAVKVPRLDVKRLLDSVPTPPAAAPRAATAQDLAYVIYTSGSTGLPKGVLVAHENLLNLIGWHVSAFGLTSSDHTTHLASVAFDAAAWEIWPTLTQGACLHVVPGDLSAAPPALVKRLLQQKINISFLPTPVAEAALKEPWPSDAALRFMLTGGDRLHSWAPAGLPFRFVNNYGPTETTVVATSGIVGPDEGAGLPSIGRPLPNYQLYILDRARRPVPPGAIGELYIGGAGVTRGYLNRPELNAERFLPDPFAKTPGARMYASGDLARHLPDGQIAFLGRRDRQVQVRGVRVEPGEIEAALAAHPKIAAAAVVSEDLKQNGDVRLVAFAVRKPGERADATIFASYLAHTLPPALVPSRVLLVDEIPLTTHGKVDYAKLAARAKESAVRAEYVAPKTQQEEVLASIWSAVLGQPNVGTADDFFELGGHSLKATQVVARAREALGIELPLKLIFERRTISKIAEALSGDTTAFEPIPRLDPSADAPAAPGQERLWFIDALSGASAAYNVPMILRLRGSLDLTALQGAMSLIWDRHEALRSTFHEKNGEAVQRIQDRPAEVLSVEEILPADLDRRIEEEISAPFSLTKGPLFRARLLKLGPKDHALIINQHHIIADAWSLAVLLRELCTAYAVIQSGETPSLPELPIRYIDWAAWQQKRLKSGRFEESLGFWRQHLLHAPEKLNLPSDRPRPARQRFRGKTKSFSLGLSTKQGLESFGQSTGASLFMIGLAAFTAYLARLSGQEDIVVGAPAANRDRRETEGVVGFFLNTLALRVDLSGDPSFAELVRRVRKSSLDAFAHQDIPFERLVAALGIPRDLSHNPLFQVMFTIQGSASEIRLPGVDIEIPAIPSTTSKFDLTLFLEPKADGLGAVFEYDTDLFDDDRIERMSQELSLLLDAVAADPERPLGELPILPDAEKAQIQAANATAQAFPQTTLSALFKAQVAKTPDAIALEHRGEKKTYRQLDQDANALADRLAALGVGPNVLVAICLDRSIPALTSVLAVIQAGGAYVPLDPSYPADRLRYMLEASSARVLLTEPKYQDLIPPGAAELLLYDQAFARPAAPERRRPQALADLAYVIYTSGSTGKPKGVAMNQRALVNLVQWQLAQEKPARTLQFAPLSFDVSFQETFTTWSSGGTLVLVDEATRRDPDALVNLMAKAEIERLFLPAVALHHLAQAALQSGVTPKHLKDVITAGDQLRITEPIRRFFETTGARLHNHYGPTESHVVTAYSLQGEPGSWPGIPSIGGPIANSAVYILDARRRPVPVGVPGELYLAGTCLADGYLGRPDLTAERFVELELHGFGGPIRAYKTGDLGSLNLDGSITFLGRADDQVKIRGFRVEPGEIERVLCAHPEVKDAAVIVDEGPMKDKRLVAYVVTSVTDTKILAAFLGADLPEYMVPAIFVRLPELPRTPSGKVDRRGLPAPIAEIVAAPADETRTPSEELVAQAFQQVLGRPQVAKSDNFFALGGHSLLAMQVIARLRDQADAQLRVSDLFENPTVESLGRAIDHKRSAGPTEAQVRIEAAPADAPIPLSFSQERLWFLDQLHPGSSAYNLPIALELKGTLDVAALKESLSDLIRRHRVFRVRFVEREGGVYQEPWGGVELPFEETDLSGASEEAVKKAVFEEAAKPYDLGRGPLFRARLFRRSATDHVLVSGMHHSVGDGWSISVLVKELAQLYAGRVAQKPAQLPAQDIDYLDFSYQQRRILSGSYLEGRLAHWKSRLAGAPEALNLPADRPRPQKVSMKGALERLRLGKDLSARIEAMSQRAGATSFMLLLSAFSAYLSRITGQDDLVVGTPVANRERAELESVIGFFVGTVPIRVDLTGDPSFEALLGRVKASSLDAFAHQDVPLEKIVEAVDPERNMGQSPLFQVMMVLQNTPEAKLGLPGLEVKTLDLEIGIAKSDLALIMEPGPDGLSGAFEYSTELFDQERIQRMGQHLLRMLEDALQHPEKKLSELELLPEPEKKALLAFANTEAAAHPKTNEKMIHQLFEEHAQRTPDAVALECGRETMSYAALNQRANHIAQHLIALGAKPEAFVGLLVPRSFDMIAALLAIWKAGAAYVPLDLAYPKARLDDIITDSGAEILLSTRAALKAWVPPSDKRILLLDALPEAEAPIEDPRSGVALHNPAYVIYTSGSTGRPKGVVLEHRGLANTPVIHREMMGCDARSVTLQFASVCFDASVFEFVMALAQGGRLVVVTADTLLAGDELADALINHKVTHAALPPSSLAALPEDRDYSCLTYLISAGEACTPEVVRRWAKPPRRFVNGYGPTESTVATTLGVCDPNHDGPPPIGVPVNNLEAHVLDPRGKQLPIGVPGELYIGGIGLARGYLNRPELNAQKFVSHPLRSGARLYKSGDLVRWRSDGRLDYLGRIDDQVKLRGYRIELGEVEAALLKHPGVSHALVLVHTISGVKSLIGYVVAKGVEGRAIKDEVKKRLPEYMVPSEVVVMEAFPLTPNGKVDKKKLPTPLLERDERPFIAPRTEAEIKLAEIWAKILERPQVSTNDHFFELGGHSLLAAQVMSRVRKSFGVEVPLSAIFENPTLEGLAAVIPVRQGPLVELPPIARANLQGDRPLSLAQERLRFLDQLEGATATYNVPVALELTGKVSARGLEKALSAVIARHEVLRTVFPLVDGKPVARPYAGAFHLVEERSDGANLERRLAEEATRPFDLSNGPLVRAFLFQRGPEDHVLLTVMHHVVSDGWSMGVLMRELTTLYASEVKGTAPALEALPIQYSDYAIWQRSWLEGKVQEKQLAYWKRTLEGAPRLLDVPTDRPRPLTRSHRGGVETFELGAETSTRLLALCRETGTTSFMTLLAAIASYLGRISGQEDVVLGSPFAGRRLPETEGLIGFFVNTLPLRVDLRGDPSFVELLGRVKETALAAHEHQDVPFERIVEVTNPERMLGTSPLFQVMFALQQAVKGQMELPGLRVAPLTTGSGTAKFDLTLTLSEGEGGIAGGIEYDLDLFDAWRIQAMAKHLIGLLERIAQNPRLRLSEIDFLSEAERQRLMPKTPAPRPLRLGVHQAIAAQAELTPGAIAVELGDQSLSYRALEDRATAVASALTARGVRPGSLVGVSMERSLDLMPAILGILKAGAGYLPLDPAYPKDRLAFMLEDSGAETVITTAKLSASYPAKQVLTIEAALTKQPREFLAQTGTLAYCLYTSGSTGRPKGVLIDHQALAAHMDWMATTMPLAHGDRVLQRTSLNFDASVWELFLPLMAGATLVLAPPDLGGDTQRLAQVLRDRRVTILQLVPSLFTLLVEEPVFAEVKTLRRLFAGGEPLPAATVKKLFALMNAEVWNLYGPTECTIDATAYRSLPESVGSFGAIEPIGKAITGMEALVLDKRLRPVPDGVPGELYLAGACVGRGYLNRPELNQERFLEHTFENGVALRMYKTGDVVRRNPDGTLLFITRADDQVKLRGFRIELGEIEDALLQHEDVSQAVAIIHSTATTKAIVAYVVTKAPVEIPALRAILKSRLPEYMLPSEIMHLDAMPTLPNGKVDKKKLPAPTLEETRAAFVAPRTPVEKILAELWGALLNKPAVGVHDDFFALGGHSLLAAQLMSRVRKSFEVDLPLSAIFEHPTLGALAQEITRKQGSAASKLPPIERRAWQGDRPLSLTQVRLRFLAELEGASPYNIPIALRLKGQLDEAALKQAISVILERHEVLRTRFPIVDGQPVARVETALPVNLSAEPLAANALDQRLREEAFRPFSLSDGPLVRTLLFRMKPGEHVLLVVIHHIVSDGWSSGVLMRELSLVYDALAQKKSFSLPPLPIQYTDYAAWQRAWLEGPAREEQLGHWKTALSGAPSVLDLPTDRPRPAVRTLRGSTADFSLSEAETTRLRALCAEAGVTPYMALLAAFGTYLARISGQEDLVIGSPFAGRRLAETEPLIGFFVNTLPLRVDLRGDPSFLEVLSRVRKQTLGAHEHQDVPFEKIVEAVKPERILGTNPIFQVMFSLQQSQQGQMQLHGLNLELVDIATDKAQFDLTLSVSDAGARILGGLEFDLDLFDAWRAEAMAVQLGRLVAALCKDPVAKVMGVDFLGAEEREALLPTLEHPAPILAQVQHVVFDQAAKTPDAVALVHGATRWTYQKLVTTSRQIASELIRRGVAPDSIVAIAMERTPEMVAAILGVLEAGACYLPIDPSYPKDRVDFMLKDSGAVLVLTQERLKKGLEHERIWALDAASLSGEARPSPQRGTLAYCLYTSGSTGTPKGVLVEHRGLSNHMRWMMATMPLEAQDRVLQRTTLSFDPSVWEIFAPLMAGATMVLAPHDLSADTERLVSLLIEEKITSFEVVPSLLAMLVEEPRFAKATSVRRVFAGGEALPIATARRFFEIHQAELWNLYGPTEATIGATAYQVDPKAIGAHGPTEPIGTAIRGLVTMVLDPRGNLVPDGVPGELYLGGFGLARGYLNRPGLTEERFVERFGLRLYRTGDVVRRHQDGNLSFLGRVDRQVKLRGFRIELGEIEAAIARHPGVIDVAVLVKELTLVAYVVAGAEAPQTEDLRRFLEKQLAAHMVPAHFAYLPALPLAPNGKVDYRALLALETQLQNARKGGVPRDPLELMLVRVFGEVLGTGEVGIYDNFFDLGGHSLLALKLKLALEKELGRSVPLVAIFQNATPELMAAALRSDTASKGSPLVPLNAAAREMVQGKKTSPALVLIPGGFSTPFYLVPLALRLEGRPVFGLQTQGLDGEETPHRTVEEEAQSIADAMQALQPEGPYLVGGHSLGGHIAYQVAQELVERKQKVSTVVLLDTAAPFPEATSPIGPGWDSAQWLLHIANTMGSFFNVELGLGLPELRAMTEEERLSAFVIKLQAAGVLPAGAGPSHVRGILEVARTQDAMAYSPKLAHPLPLLVFRAMDRGEGAAKTEMGKLVLDPSLAWERFTGRKVEVVDAPGDHMTLVREPHVDHVGKALRERLK